MTEPFVADAETRRLAVLHGSGLLDGAPEACFDALVRCAAQLSGCPVAMMSLCDGDRLWVMARHGIDIEQAGREGSFCNHVIDTSALLEVSDAQSDPRFDGNPLVCGAPFVRYYAGVPLRLDGVALGTLCVVDTQPRQLDATQLGALQSLAQSASEMLRVRQRSADIEGDRRRLLDFARASGDWMWEIDAALRFTWISGAYDAITGDSSALQMGQPIGDGLLLDGAGRPQAGGGHLHELLRAGRPFSRALVECVTANRRLVVSLSAVPVDDAAGRLVGWRGTARDMTAPIDEAAHQRLQDDLLVQVSAQVPGVIYRFRRRPDGSGRFEFINDRVASVLGVTAAELLADSRRFYAAAHPDDVAWLRHRIVEAERSGRGGEFEYRIVRPDRSVRWLSSLSSPQRLADGDVVWHGFVADITERKQTELALGASERRWEIAASATGIGIAQLDLRRGHLSFDARGCANHGLTHPHPGFSLADWFAAIHPSEQAAARAALEQAIRHGGRMEARYRFRLPDGREPWIEVTGQVEHDAEGQALSMIGTCRDITSQMAVETLRREKETAEHASRAKSAFLSRVSHELRTPLNGILGFAQLMALDHQHRLDDVQQRRLEGVQRSGQHLLALVNDVLDIARIEQDDFAPRLQAVDIAEIANTCLAAARPSAAARAVELEGRLPTACWALADARGLEQVLNQLLSNAIKFNREGGSVRLAAERHGSRLAISVVDEGPGLSAIQQAELFQPFNRLGAERRRIDGNGLGLVIARQLAAAMQGGLEVHSDGANGCRFVLELQAAALPHADEDEHIPTQPSALDAAPPRGAPPRQVLYIEDEALNRVLMQEVFRQHIGWTLHIARDGAEGLEMARELLPDLLLIDINLPDMTGIGIVQQLRGDARTAELHCIALSADALHEQMEAARAAGFDDYWTKPIDVAQLVRTLAGTLARGRPASA